MSKYADFAAVLHSCAEQLFQLINRFSQARVLVVGDLMLDEFLTPVYGDGQNMRDWLYVCDHCRALDVVIHHGKPGETYNIAGNNEVKNIDSG